MFKTILYSSLRWIAHNTYLLIFCFTISSGVALALTAYRTSTTAGAIATYSVSCANHGGTTTNPAGDIVCVRINMVTGITDCKVIDEYTGLPATNPIWSNCSNSSYQYGAPWGAGGSGGG